MTTLYHPSCSTVRITSRSFTNFQYHFLPPPCHRAQHHVYHWTTHEAHTHVVNVACKEATISRIFDKGERYYQLDGSQIWLPRRSEDQPNREFLEWHGDSVYLG